ncbi:hypothetical protein [Streptomyces sp. S4.7]|uniref:hypothetical protein n=1 Tax=Streptomyces sp. S4.7 TaxID=2705439 RepID=UPI0013DB1515|nr:hypothetical protein [Streptomyces sp. S4.7]
MTGLLAAAPAPRDLFLVVRVCSPAVDEVAFQGALDPHTPVAQCRLRASRRRLDPELSTSTTAPSRWSPAPGCPTLRNDLTGCGPFLHNDDRDRVAGTYDGRTTVHTGGDHASYLLLPVIPGAERARQDRRDSPDTA